GSLLPPPCANLGPVTFPPPDLAREPPPSADLAPRAPASGAALARPQGPGPRPPGRSGAASRERPQCGFGADRSRGPAEMRGIIADRSSSPPPPALAATTPPDDPRGAGLPQPVSPSACSS